MTPAEWKSGPAFAEVAEALGINTNQVLLATVDHGIMIVLYTPDVDGRPPLWRAEMQRDADGLIVVMGDPVEIEMPPHLRDLLEEDGG